ncbi:MAG: retroviral-like aspartic protease family protein [Acetobacter sp.]|nr:retroviral-like aspartic protease family protein [Acetobacter sp.]MBR2124102.1 retroviral-like aspartic protease family protein [Acetobacter sp.]
MRVRRGFFLLRCVLLISLFLFPLGGVGKGVAFAADNKEASKSEKINAEQINTDTQTIKDKALYKTPCHTLIARVSVDNKDGFLVIPVAINGHDARMIIDTGAEGSLLSPAASVLFDTSHETERWTLMHGTGGVGRLVPDVHVTSLRIGFAQFGPLSIPVAALPSTSTPRVAGLIGGDLLSRYDIELDVSQHMMALWQNNLAACQKEKGAQTGPVGWRYIYRAVPLTITAHHRAFVTVSLDGHSLRALLDTGARARVLAERVALRLGVSAKNLAAEKGGVTQGVDAHKEAYYWHKFHLFQIGQEQDLYPTLTVTPLQDTADMLLGVEWFARHRVWISYQTKMLYIMPIER